MPYSLTSVFANGTKSAMDTVMVATHGWTFSGANYFSPSGRIMIQHGGDNLGYTFMSAALFGGGTYFAPAGGGAVHHGAIASGASVSLEMRIASGADHILLTLAAPTSGTGSPTPEPRRDSIGMFRVKPYTGPTDQWAILSIPAMVGSGNRAVAGHRWPGTGTSKANTETGAYSILGGSAPQPAIISTIEAPLVSYQTPVSGGILHPEHAANGAPLLRQFVITRVGESQPLGYLKDIYLLHTFTPTIGAPTSLSQVEGDILYVNGSPYRQFRPYSAPVGMGNVRTPLGPDLNYTPNPIVYVRSD
jgi:hypothetical protein